MTAHPTNNQPGVNKALETQGKQISLHGVQRLKNQKTKHSLLKMVVDVVVEVVQLQTETSKDKMTTFKSQGDNPTDTRTSTSSYQVWTIKIKTFNKDLIL